MTPRGITSLNVKFQESDAMNHTEASDEALIFYVDNLVDFWDHQLRIFISFNISEGNIL